MEEVRLFLSLGEGREGITIINAMEKIAGLRLVRYSVWGDKEKWVYFIGCRGSKNQAGDARISAGFGVRIDPDEVYDFLEIENHPWIEGIGKHYELTYMETPKPGQIVRAMKKLQRDLKRELEV